MLGNIEPLVVTGTFFSSIDCSRRTSVTEPVRPSARPHGLVPEHLTFALGSFALWGIQ